VTSPPDLRLSVAVPTFRRPELLDSLLGLLPERVAEVGDRAVVTVLVVDNDPDGSARDIVARHPADLFTYVHQPVPGIAAARNRALETAATTGADLVAFVDDDERPRPGWLPSLLDTWARTRPAAVMGRVISVFAEEPDPWLIATGVFRRRARETGTTLPVAAAGNLLVDVRQVQDLGVEFDPTLGLSGGEDTLFSRQLVARGAAIVWCNESEAEDLVPAERLTRSWAMRRAFNGGNSVVQVELRMSSGPRARALVRTRRAVGGAGRIVAGLGRHLVGRIGGDLEHDARGLRTVHRGRGMVAGALGHVHEQYAREG
jgi:succinoglycan biosynthesis protein ExoM